MKVENQNENVPEKTPEEIAAGLQELEETLAEAQKREADRRESETRVALEIAADKAHSISDAIRTNARAFLTTIHQTVTVAPNYLAAGDKDEIAHQVASLTSALGGDDDVRVLEAQRRVQDALDKAVYRTAENDAQRRLLNTGGVPSKVPYAQGNEVEKFTPSDLADDEETVDLVFPNDVLLTISAWKTIQFRKGVQKVPVSLKDHFYLKAHGVHTPVIRQHDPVAIASQPGIIPARDKR